MSLTAPKCPSCGAPLVTSRFAATAVCGYCGTTARVDPSAVSAARFRESWKAWNRPADEGMLRFSLGDAHWNVERRLARGEISDVFLAKRARWPSELVLIKALRNEDDADLLDCEWRALEKLSESAAEWTGFAARVPAPVARGRLEGEGRTRPGVVYRWAAGFVHTFEAIRAAYPAGIPPVSSIWVWRRLLEILTALERADLVHGALLPHHLLVQTGEHGVRLVGFSCADAPGAALRAVCAEYESFYPERVSRGGKLGREVDLVMSARCIAYLLGGSPTWMLPASVPRALAEVVEGVATGRGASRRPWDLREELGAVARSLFGPPSFHPIAMP